MQTATGSQAITSAPDHPYPVHRQYLLVLGSYLPHLIIFGFYSAH